MKQKILSLFKKITFFTIVLLTSSTNLVAQGGLPGGGGGGGGFPTSTTWGGSFWSSGNPSPTVDAFIASNIAPGAFSCRNLTINSGFTFTNNATVSVWGSNITNSGNGIVGTGTLQINGQNFLRG